MRLGSDSAQRPPFGCREQLLVRLVARCLLRHGRAFAPLLDLLRRLAVSRVPGCYRNLSAPDGPLAGAGAGGARGLPGATGMCLLRMQGGLRVFFVLRAPPGHDAILGNVPVYK